MAPPSRSTEPPGAGAATAPPPSAPAAPAARRRRSRRPRLPRGRVGSFVAVAAGLLALAGVLAGATSEGRYLLRAGWEEARILALRRPLDQVADDPATAPERSSQLREVLAAREFAVRRLGLDAGGTYTSFADVGPGPLLWVLSASPRERLEDYRWWYPIVGSVPYKGFFSEELAEEARRRLEADGYDTHLRTASAFSTLGWFPDPLLSTALAPDPTVLATTVFHEIAHDVLWVPGEVAFNESFATWAGLQAAERFHAARGDRAAAARAGALWRDERRLEAFYSGLAAELESLYASGVASQTLEHHREEILARARRTLAGSLAAQLEVYDGRTLAEAPLNNATVLAARIYRTDLESFERALMLHGNDLAAAIAAVAEAVEERADEVTPGEAVAAIGG